MMEDLPAEVLSQLSCMPEERPGDFTCAICGSKASNHWNWSPRDYERPPICKSCEGFYTTTSHYSGRRTMRPTAGSFRDRREAMRLYAIAEALGTEAVSIEWRTKYGCP